MSPGETSIPSPFYGEKPDAVDLNVVRDETTLPAIKEVLKLLNEESEKVVVSFSTTDRKEIDNIYNDFGHKVLAILSEKNVAFSDYDHFFEYLQTIFRIAQQIVMKQVNGHKTEILSRYIGKRNPASGKFDVDYSNFGDLLTSLIKVQKETGNNPEDYFTLTPEKKD